ncbi:MAG: hypothetical protein KatS3mg102_2089 [Planctomycetota bacterium]|nr:MAG: hypothetical protein KatS3mg102_2089 [Planctomycetota bacterium]
MPRFQNSRTTVDEIARAYERLRQGGADPQLLAYLTKQYVLDGTMPFNLPSEREGQLGDVTGAEEEFTFARLIDQLKKRLPRMKELGYFHLEDGRVTLRVANQKIVFGERVTSEFVAEQPRRPRPLPPRQRAASRLRPARPPPAAARPARPAPPRARSP